MKRIILPLLAFCWAIASQGQVIVNNAITPQQGINNMLGGGVNAFNINYSGSANQIGLFTAVNSNLGMNSGFIMASGDVTSAVGPNASGSYTVGGGNQGASDADLEILDPDNGHNDAVVLEFDFVATGDTVTFEYIWASDEYPEFANSGFNDVFGFFLSGPGINGTFTNNAENIALIPGTTSYVSINNLNNGTAEAGPCEYCEYYVANGNGGGTDPNLVQYDGFTTVLTAVAVMQCDSTYHIKLAVADAGDTGYDSAVFIKEGSFSSNGLVDVEVTNPPIVNWPAATLAEGCIYGSFEVFEDDLTTLDTLEIWYSGTALNGVDYELLPDTVIIPIGQASVIIPVIAIDDNLPEGNETLIISFEYYNDCGHLDTTFAQVEIVEQSPIILSPMSDVSFCPNGSTQVAVNPQGGFPPYSFVWSNDAETQLITIDELGPYTVTVTDFCGQTEEVSFDAVLPPSPIISVNLDEIFVCPTSTATAVASGTSGTSPYTFVWSESSTSGATGTFDIDDLGTQYVTLTDNCGFSDMDSVIVTLVEVPPTVDVNVDDLFICPNGLETAVATAGNGTPPYSYGWTNSSTTGATGSFNFDDAGFQYVTVTDHCGYTAIDSVLIEVPTPLVADDNKSICIGMGTGVLADGGTFPYQYFYDSLAFTFSNIDLLVAQIPGSYEVNIIDDCGQTDQITIYVEICDTYVPNIFTPNGDGDNDAFEVAGGENFPGSSMLIYNRWGNLVYESDNYIKNWNGLENSPGTYFYIYTRSDGKVYKGNVTLMREK